MTATRPAGASESASAARSGSRRAWWRPGAWDALALLTALLAVTIALGPVTGVYPVAVASLLWFGAVAWLVVDVVGRQLRSWSGWSWLTLAGVGLATLRMTSLGWLQTVGGRPALYWNVDGRYLASLARSISRFSGVGDSLDYAGEPLQYHAGPSWIAGSLHRALGVPIDFTLFVLVPAACVVVIALSGYRLLRRFGAPSVAALVGVVLALNLPRDPVWMVDHARGGVREVLLAPSSWIFNASLILNALLALAVALTAMWVIVERRGWWSGAIGCTSLGALAGLKPQFLPAALAILVPVFVVQAWRRDRRVPWVELLVGIAWVAVVAGVVLLANPQVIEVSGMQVHPARAVLDLADSQPFAGRVPQLAALAVVVLVAVPALRRRQDPLLVGSSTAATAGGVLSMSALLGTTMLVAADAVLEANRFGFPISRDWMDINFSQALILVGFVLAAVATAQFTVVARSTSGWFRYVPAVLVALLLVATLPGTLSALRDPHGRAAHEWTEETALRALVGGVDTRDGLWLTSDMADSAEGYLRPLRAVNLTSLSDAQYYLANIEYNGWARDDAGRRLEASQRFFDTEWSSWHDRFVDDHDVRYVLVHDRCPPRWSAGDFPGEIVGSRGGWTLLRVTGEVGAAATEKAWPSYTGEAGYGVSPCLTYSES